MCKKGSKKVFSGLMALGLVLCWGFVSLAQAEVPKLINYQGKLTDTGGKPVTDGNYAITFKLYSQPTGGSALWTEANPTVAISNGLFNVILGSLTTLGLDFSQGYYLGITVGAEPEMTPRQRLTSVGYAMTADSLGGGAVNVDTNGKVGIGTTNPQLKLTIYDNVVATGLAIDTPQPRVRFYERGTAKWDLAHDVYPDRLTLYRYGYGYVLSVDPDGNVGIGVMYPQSKLDVCGTLRVGTNGTGYDVNCYGADAGSRLLWDESKMAFRAGMVTGTQWDDANVGLNSFATGYNTKATATYSTAMGVFTTASGGASTAMGYDTTASGYESTAMGLYTTASGNYSTAMGESTTASGDHSTTMGFSTTASGNYSTAMGANTAASGHYSTTMGYNTAASGDYSTAMGRNIEAQGDYSVAIALSYLSPKPVVSHNTMAIMGGKVGIGTTTPSYVLQLPNIASVNGQGLANAWQTYSSKRWKTNIVPIDNAVDKVARLRGVYFDWKENGKHDIGLIAEEVGEVIPEVVSYEENGKDALALDYAKLTALLIEAVKAQQEKITALEQRILELEKK